jgi:hypothetical protein
MVPFEVIGRHVTAYVVSLGPDIDLYYSRGRLIAARIAAERYKENKNIIPEDSFAHFEKFSVTSWPYFNSSLVAWVESKIKIEVL